jgi:hypothetical protein
MRRGFATPGGLVGNRGNFGAGNCDKLLQIWQRSIALVKKLAKRSIALVKKIGKTLDRTCKKIGKTLDRTYEKLGNNRACGKIC